jgi:sulfane dehydrogenase subunit SoxC
MCCDGRVADGISREELQLAARNHGLPLEALRYDVTPAGLHYLLIHFDIPHAEAASWRLSVGGAVSRELTFPLEDLRARRRVSAAVTLECAGNGRALLEPRPISQPWLVEAVGTAEWTGTPLRGVLEEAGIGAETVEVLFTGADRGIQGEVEHAYERSLPLEEALREDVLLVDEMNGAPLLPQHGFPLRLIVPGWYGMTHVKWLERITLLSEPFEGYQQRQAYRIRQEPDEVGEPVTRIHPRSLLLPPGIPEFMGRGRVLGPGPCHLTGRAWSGLGAIERVEVSTDDGATWTDASLGPPPSSPYAWRSWSFDWIASPGTYIVCSRATDSSGATQPLEPGWNLEGFRNNALHRVSVAVRG